MSFSSLVSGDPETTKRFSLTENWAKFKVRVFSRGRENRKRVLLTLWSSQVDNGVVVLEHVDLIDVLEGLHAELFDG